MGAELTSVEGNTVKLEVTVELGNSMLENEQAILSSLNEAGMLATEQSLHWFDTDGGALVMGGQKWFSKGAQPKKYQTPYGEVSVKRHVYQGSGGGKTYCPMEERARIVVRSTPRFAKMASHKLAHGSTVQAAEDLEENHGRKVARSFLSSVAEAVGAIAQAKEQEWEYETPKLDAEVATVATGLDGTTMLLCEDGWREAMAGTVSLYDAEGNRLHSIYVGATPEYGKATFYERLGREMTHVRELYPQARQVGIADGARVNWEFLEGKVSETILDFYHAAGYVGKAAPAALPTDPLGREAWTEERCHDLKHEAGAASRFLAEMEALPQQALPDDSKQALKSSITYFRNHKDKMDYARFTQEGLPIGSGVTEAACKQLVKQRLCQAGMRWKEKGAGVVLTLRALALTTGRWPQFWNKIDQYGVPCVA